MSMLDHGDDDTLMAEALERWANITNSYAGSVDSDLRYEDRQIVSKAVRMFPALLEIVRAAQVVIAARHGATFPQWVAANDALAAALAKLNPKETT